MKTLLVTLLLMAPTTHAASRCRDDLAAYDQRVEELKNDFARIPADPRDPEWVKRKLAHMVEIDQFMRKQSDLPFLHAYDEAEKAEFQIEYLRRFNEVDQANTHDLETLLERYAWFTISAFGAKADNDAWLLVQHADENPDFQKRVLAILTDLWPRKETNARNFAYLFDRVAASYQDPSKRTLQLYGTQGFCVGPGVWEPIPIEDPAKVDERRASVGLGTMEEYKAMFKEICR